MYAKDGRRVPLLYGKKPFWRTLHRGMSGGPDVKVLEQNLDALGYGDGMPVDRAFTYATYLAVIDWQDDLHVSETGKLGAGDVVVHPGAIRATEVKAVRGARGRPAPS